MRSEVIEEKAGGGLETFRFGVESGSQKIVDSIGKNLDLKKVKDCIKWCNDLNIKTHMTHSGEKDEKFRL